MKIFEKGVLATVLSGLLIFSFVSFISAYGIPGAPSCNSASPKAPWLSSVKVVGSGSVELVWTGVESASSWTVAYGVTSGKYIYGLSNFGNGSSRSVKIGSLPTGTYYFVVRANNDCAPGPFSKELRVAVGSGTGAAVVTSTPVAKTETITGKATPTPKSTYVPGKPTPTPKAIVTPTPKPVKVGFWQGIADFFRNLFK